MDRSKHSTHDTGMSDLERAEYAVAMNAQKFEAAMDHLAEKVEGSSRSMHHAVEVANRPLLKLQEWRERAITAVQPLKPYYERASETSSAAVAHIRANPRPYWLGAIGIVGFWAGFERGRRRRLEDEIYADIDGDINAVAAASVVTSEIGEGTVRGIIIDVTTEAPFEEVLV